MNQSSYILILWQYWEIMKLYMPSLSLCIHMHPKYIVSCACMYRYLFVHFVSVVCGRPQTHAHPCNICYFAKNAALHDLLHCRVWKGYCNASFAIVLNSCWLSLNLGRPKKVLSKVLVQPVMEVEIGCKVQNRILITPGHQVHRPSRGLSVDTDLKIHFRLPPHGISMICKIGTLGYQIFGIVNMSQSLVYDADPTLYINFHMCVRMYILVCSLFSDHHLKFQMLKV